MYGFIITTHYNNYTIIKKSLDLLIEYIPHNSFIILYINETTCQKVLNVKNAPTNHLFVVIELLRLLLLLYNL